MTAHVISWQWDDIVTWQRDIPDDHESQYLSHEHKYYWGTSHLNESSQRCCLGSSYATDDYLKSWERGAFLYNMALIKWFVIFGSFNVNVIGFKLTGHQTYIMLWCWDIKLPLNTPHCAHNIMVILEWPRNFYSWWPRVIAKERKFGLTCLWFFFSQFPQL